MTKNPKILNIDELAVRLRELKAAGKKIVLSHGVFDLLHVGHIRHFEQAKRMGDVLVVTLTEDRSVNKGPHRPAFQQDLRSEVIAALDCVDFVAVNRWPLAVETIKLLRPDIYVKGSDYKIAAQDITGGITPETEAVRSVGGEIRFTEGMTFSSSRLLNVHFSPFTDDVNRYLDAFRKRHSEDEILGWLDRAAGMTPTVIGEAIVDEYIFCDGIGKSTKDPVLAVLRRSVEACAGGSLAVANHLAGLCRDVRLVTQLGDHERREEFVRSSLKPNVQLSILTKSDSPTICKQRIVDQYTASKLIETYVMNDRLTSGDSERELCNATATAIRGRDLIVVTDYGHGMMTHSVIEILCNNASFLAVNVQSNAGNRGFNSISKYPKADYVCIANHEVDIETRRKEGDVRDRLMEVARRIDCSRFTITMGKLGSLHYDSRDGFLEAPALAARVLDRVGAGDAVLAVTSLLVRLGAPWDIVAFVGNVAGAQLVAELGNRVPLERVALAKHITSILK